MARRKASDTSISKEKIVETALLVLDEDGPLGLTLAKVAERLSVTTPSIYWYFPSKEALIASITATLFGQSLSDVCAPTSYEDFLLQLGNSLLATLRRHRNATGLIATVHLDRDNPLEDFVAQAADWGTASETSLSHIIAIQAFVLGWSTFENNQSIRDRMSQSIDIDHTFENYLRAIVQVRGA